MGSDDGTNAVLRCPLALLHKRATAAVKGMSDSDKVLLGVTQEGAERKTSIVCRSYSRNRSSAVTIFYRPSE